MNSVFGVLPCAHATCIGYFLLEYIQQQIKEWNQELYFWSLPKLFLVFALFYSFQSIFILFFWISQLYSAALI